MRRSQPEVSSSEQHPLRQVSPAFLDLLDRDRDAAWEDFYRFGWRLLMSTPPRILAGVGPEGRQELVSRILHHCAENDFRVLRHYRAQGAPFAAWLMRVAHNYAADALRHDRIRELPVGGELPDTTDPRQDPAREHESRVLLEAVRGALLELSEKCRLLLEAAADGLRPRQMTALLGLPAHQNKKVGDQLRECRRTLERRLLKEGWDLRSEGSS